MDPADFSFQRLPLNPNGHLFAASPVLVTVIRFNGEERLMDIPFSCAVCDQRPQVQVLPTEVAVTNSCPYPNGIITEITLAVPSGKIVVADSLSPLYHWDRDEVGDYNSTAGQAKAIRAMEAAGCAYGPVGNSCPGLYRTGPDSYTIARPGWDDDYEELPAEGERLAGICTNSWGYSIADLDDFLQRGGDVDGFDADVVEVSPGVYRFTHLTGQADFDHYAAGPLVFARVQRVS
jgi:hypothetical protein